MYFKNSQLTQYFTADMRRSQRNHKFKSPMLVFKENEQITEPVAHKISTQTCLEHDNSIFGLIELPQTPKLDDSSSFLSPRK